LELVGLDVRDAKEMGPEVLQRDKVPEVEDPQVLLHLDAPGNHHSVPVVAPLHKALNVAYCAPCASRTARTTSATRRRTLAAGAGGRLHLLPRLQASWSACRCRCSSLLLNPPGGASDSHTLATRCAGAHLRTPCQQVALGGMRRACMRHLLPFPQFHPSRTLPVPTQCIQSVLCLKPAYKVSHLLPGGAAVLGASVAIVETRHAPLELRDLFLDHARRIDSAEVARVLGATGGTRPMLAAAFSQVFEDPASKGHAAAGEAPASLAGGGLGTGAVHTSAPLSGTVDSIARCCLGFGA